jgi:two-component system LytT family response regulator
MKKLRVLIVDDEPLARSLIAKLLAPVPDCTIVGQADNGVRALQLIRAEGPDLVFLDVQMPGLTGLELLDALKSAPPPQVIFTTAHRQFALEAFSRAAVDYLVKPFSQDRFLAALDRARQRMGSADFATLSGKVGELLRELAGLQQATAPAPAPTAAPAKDSFTLVVKADGELHFIDTDQLLWIEGNGDYLKLHTVAGPHPVVRETIKNMEARLAGRRFFRIHKSAMVNLDFVHRMRPLPAGDYIVTLRNGTELKLSRLRKSALDHVLQREPVGATG